MTEKETSQLSPFPASQEGEVSQKAVEALAAVLEDAEESEKPTPPKLPSKQPETPPETSPPPSEPPSEEAVPLPPLSSSEPTVETEEKETILESEQPEWVEIIRGTRKELNTLKEKAAAQKKEKENKLEAISKKGEEHWLAPTTEEAPGAEEILGRDKTPGAEEWQEAQSRKYKTRLRGEKTKAENEIRMADAGLALLTQWEYYFVHPELASEIAENQKAVESLKKSIKGRRLAGVESAKLQKELASHEKWLKELKGNVPPEILGEEEEQPGYYQATQAYKITQDAIEKLKTQADMVSKEASVEEKTPEEKTSPAQEPASPDEQEITLTDEEREHYREIRQEVQNLLNLIEENPQNDEVLSTPEGKEAARNIVFENYNIDPEKWKLFLGEEGKEETEEGKGETEEETEWEPWEQPEQPQEEPEQPQEHLIEAPKEAHSEQEIPSKGEVEEEIRRLDKIWKDLKTKAHNWLKSISPKDRNKIAYAIGLSVGVAESHLVAIAPLLPFLGSTAKTVLNAAFVNGIISLSRHIYSRNLRQTAENLGFSQEETKDKTVEELKQLILESMDNPSLREGLDIKERKHEKAEKYVRDFAVGMAAGSILYMAGNIAVSTGQAVYHAYFRPQEVIATTPSEVATSAPTATPEPTSVPTSSSTSPPISTTPEIPDAETLESQTGAYAQKVTPPHLSPTETPSTVEQVARTTKSVSESTPPLEVELPQKAAQIVKEAISPDSFFDQTVTIEPGQSFWSSLQVNPDYLPNGNWQNPLNGVNLEDVIKDLVVKSARANGTELSLVHPGDTFSLREILTPEQIETIKKAMQTANAGDYWQNVRP